MRCVIWGKMSLGSVFRIVFIFSFFQSSATVFACSKDNNNFALKRLLRNLVGVSTFSENREFRPTPHGVEVWLGGIRQPSVRLVERYGPLVREIKYDFFEAYSDEWGIFSLQKTDSEWELVIAKKANANFELKQTLRLQDTGSISDLRVLKTESGQRYLYFAAGQHFVKVALNLDKPLKAEVFPVTRSRGYIDMGAIDSLNGVRGVLRYSAEQVQATFNPDIKAFTFSDDGKFLLLVFSGERKSGGSSMEVAHGVLVDLRTEPFVLSQQSRLMGMGLMRDRPFADFMREGERASRVLGLSKPIRTVTDLRVEQLLQEVQGQESFVVKARLGFADGTEEFTKILRLNLALD